MEHKFIKAENDVNAYGIVDKDAEIVTGQMGNINV
jgi:hypothetical protein